MILFSRLTRAEANERLHGADKDDLSSPVVGTRSHWIIKGNPRENDLDDMLVPGVRHTWRTARPPSDWKAGDRLFFWKSGSARQLVGLGEFLGLRPREEGKLQFFQLRYDTEPFEHPLDIEELRADKIVGDASFLKAGPAGTVFPLRDDQAKRLLELIAEHNPQYLDLCAAWLADLRAHSSRSDAPLVAPDELDAILRASPNFIEGRGIRTLSVRQPWAWSILHGGKDVENRSQPTHVRGTIALHASASAPDPANLDFLHRKLRLRIPAELPLGAIVGFVDIVDCKDNARSRWADPGSMHWMLANPRPLGQPMPASGAVGFWYWLPR